MQVQAFQLSVKMEAVKLLLVAAALVFATSLSARAAPPEHPTLQGLRGLAFASSRNTMASGEGLWQLLRSCMTIPASVKLQQILQVDPPLEAASLGCSAGCTAVLDSPDTRLCTAFAARADARDDEMTLLAEADDGVPDEDSIDGDEADRIAFEAEVTTTPAATSSSEWPTFGIVGERQAALYYTTFLVFTALFLKNSAGSGRSQQARKSGSAL